jgi:hypothetical protein
LPPPPPALASALDALQHALAAPAFTAAVATEWGEGRAPAWRSGGARGNAPQPPPISVFSAQELAAFSLDCARLAADAHARLAADAQSGSGGSGGGGGGGGGGDDAVFYAEEGGGEEGAARQWRAALLLRALAVEALRECRAAAGAGGAAAPADAGAAPPGGSMWARLRAGARAPTGPPLAAPSDVPGTAQPLRTVDAVALRGNVMPRQMAAGRRRTHAAAPPPQPPPPAAPPAAEAAAQQARERGLSALVAATMKRLEEALPIFPY